MSYTVTTLSCVHIIVLLLHNILLISVCVYAVCYRNVTCGSDIRATAHCDHLSCFHIIVILLHIILLNQCSVFHGLCHLL